MFGLVLFAMIVFSFVCNVRLLLKERKQTKRKTGEKLIKNEDL